MAISSVFRVVLHVFALNICLGASKLIKITNFHIKFENSILELPILGFRTIHITFVAAHFEKWEALGLE
jgi:hypothetical protein